MAGRQNFRLFDSYETAVEAVYDLEMAGVPAEQINVIGSSTDPRFAVNAIGEDGESWIGRGAVIGATIGGVAGTLAAIGAIPLPGVGPLVAGGWLATASSCAGIGAAGCAVLGGLVQRFGPARQHHLAAMRLQHGATMVQLTGKAATQDVPLSVLAGRQGDLSPGQRRDPTL